MGRAASHITLECALQTHPNITIIGEEVCVFICLVLLLMQNIFWSFSFSKLFSILFVCLVKSHFVIGPDQSYLVAGCSKEANTEKCH